MASTNLTMRLFIDTKNHKVICAEGNKQVVDFYHRILSLPLSWHPENLIDLVTSSNESDCMNCNHKSDKGSSSVDVKETTYMITDDLWARPLSGISSVINLLGMLNVKDVGSVKQEVISLSEDKTKKILKAASSQSQTVLTNVFLPKRYRFVYIP